VKTKRTRRGVGGGGLAGAKAYVRHDPKSSLSPTAPPPKKKREKIGVECGLYQIAYRSYAYSFHSFAHIDFNVRERERAAQINSLLDCFLRIKRKKERKKKFPLSSSSSSFPSPSISIPLNAVLYDGRIPQYHTCSKMTLINTVHEEGLCPTQPLDTT